MSNPGDSWVDYEKRMLRFDDGVIKRHVPKMVELNVFNYNAIADGATDTQPMIQAAVDDLPLWGGRVIIPKAAHSYFLGDDITINKSNVEIIIENGAHVEADIDASVGACFLFAAAGPSSWDDLTVDPSAGDISITVTTPGDFTAGDWVTIKDDDTGSSGATHWEKNRVRSKSGSVLTLEYPLADDYTTQGTVAPSVAVTNPVVGSGITGGGVVQNGDPSDSTKGNSGIWFSHAVGGYCRGVEAQYCRTDAIRVFDSLMCEVSDNYLHDSSQFDGNGRGVTPTRSTHTIVKGNRIVRMRHLVDVSSFCRYTLVDDNICRGHAEGGLFTHPDTRYTYFIDNHVDGGYGYATGTGADWGTQHIGSGIATREYTRDCLIEGNKVSNVRSSGISIHGEENNDVIVRDNDVWNCNLAGSTLIISGISAVQGVDTRTMGTGLVIEGNRVSDMVGRGITCGFPNATVRKNTVKNIRDNSGATCGIYIRPYTSTGTPDAIGDIEVEHNHVEDIEGYGIRVGFSSSYVVSDCTVQHNTVRNTDKTGIYAIPSQVDRLTLDDNTLIDCNEDAATADGAIVAGGAGATDVASDHLVITNNKVHGDAKRAIHCNVAGAVIKGNRIFDQSVMGIYLPAGASGQSSLDMLIDDNLIVDCVNGIYAGSTVNGTTDDAVIQRNTIIGATNAIRLLATVDGTKIKGNMTWNCTNNLVEAGSTNTEVISHYDPDDAQEVYGAISSTYSEPLVVEDAFRANNGIAYAYDEISAGTTALTKNHHYVEANTVGGTVTLNLPATDASDIKDGKEYIIKKLGSNTLAINPNGSNTVEGASSHGADMIGGDCIVIRSDGGTGAAGNWSIIADYWSQTKKVTEVFKTSESQVVNNSTTYVDDDTLALALLASTVYWFQFDFWWDTATAADFSFQMAYTGGHSVRFSSEYVPPGTNVHVRERVYTAFSQTFSALSDAGTVGHGRVTGILTTTATGTLKLTWAQNTADVSDTKVLIGSKLRVEKVE